MRRPSRPSLHSACLHTSSTRTHPGRTSCAAARPSPNGVCAPSSAPPPSRQRRGSPPPAPAPPLLEGALRLLGGLRLLRVFAPGLSLLPGLLDSSSRSGFSLAATSNRSACAGFFVEVVLILHLQPELASPLKDHLGRQPSAPPSTVGFSDKLLVKSTLCQATTWAILSASTQG